MQHQHAISSNNGKGIKKINITFNQQQVTHGDCGSPAAGGLRESFGGSITAQTNVNDSYSPKLK
jgi:hypothetical protein